VRKATTLALAIMMFAFFMAPVFGYETKNDFQAIKKAVKENPNYEPGREVKWFKVLVTDNKTNKTKVQVTLPISLVEFLVRCAEDKHIRMHRHECDINLEELLAELKKAGPMALIEVYEEDETVKVWIE